MKHIFVVHSNITYLSALGTIAHDKLSTQDVMIVSQHYARQEPIEIKRIKLFSKNIFNPAMFFNLAYRTDKLVNQFTKDQPFCLYVPAMTKPAKVLATNPHCTKICFIEEGMGSYMVQFALTNHTYEDRTGSFRAQFSWKYIKQTATSLVNLIRGETQHLHSLPLNYTSYAGDPRYLFYGFHQAVFPLAPISEQRLVSMTEILNNFDFLRTLQLDGQYILIGEGLFTLDSSYSLDEYFNTLSNHVIPWLKERNVKRLYIKHHYNESEHSRQGSIKIFQQEGIQIEVIPDNMILEMELIGAQNTTLIGCSSSLLFYGALMGSRSYSYANRLDRPLLDIKAYWQEVKLI